MTSMKICGCKGIRTCLLCENEGNANIISQETDKPKSVYIYCSFCNLCWPEGEDAPQKPLYLGRLNLFLDFLDKEEEENCVSAIDRIEWKPSQSGRRKQDFGPKVNFKKKKVKTGEFRGFPTFTEDIVNKFRHFEELSGFQAAELCHLEYTPERGSSIDPHIDDFWLWGERLVTVNLQSATVLCLTPSSPDECKCSKELDHNLFRYVTSMSETESRHEDCRNCDCLSCSNNSAPSGEKVKKSNQALGGFTKHRGRDVICKIHDQILLQILSNYRNENCYNSSANKEAHFTSGLENGVAGGRIRSVCSVIRSNGSSSEIEILVELPPRSLLILAGCSRYNWFHAIKRKDVASRRLAMTFRELTPEFLVGNQRTLGKELLSIAGNYLDFSESC